MPSNMIVTAFGESKKLNDWVKDKRCKTSADCIYTRVFKKGWDVELAISTPPKNVGYKLEDFKKGDKFVYLTLTGVFKNEKNKNWAECICVCGGVRYYSISILFRGQNKSCGCKKGEGTGNGLRTHGLTRINNGRRHPLYGIWLGMKYRCYSKTDRSFHNYGGRGIKMSDYFLVFENFYDWALKSGYKKCLTIDRKENNGDYSETNCRWITISEQQSNKRTCVMIEAFGETKTISAWAKDIRSLVSVSAIKERIFTKGWGSEKAITTPPKIKRCA